MSGAVLRRVALAALPFAAVVLVVASPVASATPLKAGTTYYAVGKPACKPPKGKGALPVCFAEIRVLAKKGTKGARPFKAAAGATASATIGPAGGLTPGDLASAYGLATTGGAGQTVALIDAYNDPNINADLQTFDTQYGLATCSESNGCLKVVNESGGSTLPSNDTIGWSVEESLDVEAVHSVCQGCKILVVEATTQSVSDLSTAANEAVKLGATEVSNSWGYPESDTNSTVQGDFNHPGVVVTASTGDDGFYSFDMLSGTNEPDIPASYNTVVAAGGTSLYLGQTAARQNETVWNDNGTKDYNEQVSSSALGAGGGGCSTLFPAQGWQTHLSVWSSTACGSKRLGADVSTVADYLTGLDIYISYNCGGACSTGWQTVGGTSLSSVLIAATYGLAGGAHGISYPALTLYGHLGSSYDVITGGNGWCGGEGAAECSCNYSTCSNVNPNLNGWGWVDCAWNASGVEQAGDAACDAALGYDGPTGVGSPKGLTMFTRTGPTAKMSGPTLVPPGTSETWTASTADPFPGGAVTSYAWNWGDGSANTVTTTASASHTYTTGGIDRTITLTARDNYGVTGTATYKVSVCCSANGSGTMTTPTKSVVHGSAGQTIAFTYTAAAGGISGGAVTLTVPSGWSAPSITTTGPGYTTASAGTLSVSGQTITVSGLTLAGGQTMTITYGSKSKGGPGATAPSTAVGTQTWLTEEKSTSSGTLTKLASSPQITIS